MRKKVYMRPEALVVRVETSNMLAESEPITSTNPAVPGLGMGSNKNEQTDIWGN